MINTTKECPRDARTVFSGHGECWGRERPDSSILSLFCEKQTLTSLEPPDASDLRALFLVDTVITPLCASVSFFLSSAAVLGRTGGVVLREASDCPLSEDFISEIAFGMAATGFKTLHASVSYV